jgi:hypothetical protein
VYDSGPPAATREGASGGYGPASGDVNPRLASPLFNQGWGAIITLELAKKRGENPSDE